MPRALPSGRPKRHMADRMQQIPIGIEQHHTAMRRLQLSKQQRHDRIGLLDQQLQRRRQAGGAGERVYRSRISPRMRCIRDKAQQTAFTPRSYILERRTEESLGLAIRHDAHDIRGRCPASNRPDRTWGLCSALPAQSSIASGDARELEVGIGHPGHQAPHQPSAPAALNGRRLHRLGLRHGGIQAL
jgi:hypothetical protein